MSEFFQTRMGQKFYEGTMPRLVKALERIADSLGRITDSLDDIVKLEREKKP
jgi:hypothetical protein